MYLIKTSKNRNATNRYKKPPNGLFSTTNKCRLFDHILTTNDWCTALLFWNSVVFMQYVAFLSYRPLRSSISAILTLRLVQETNILIRRIRIHMNKQATWFAFILEQWTPHSRFSICLLITGLGWGRFSVFNANMERNSTLLCGLNTTPFRIPLLAATDSGYNLPKSPRIILQNFLLCCPFSFRLE